MCLCRCYQHRISKYPCSSNSRQILFISIECMIITSGSSITYHTTQLVAAAVITAVTHKAMERDTTSHTNTDK